MTHPPAPQPRRPGGEGRPGRGRPGPHAQKILIVDDHPVVRRGLRELLSREPGLEVCGEAETGPDAIRLVESLSPDLVIVDISLKEGSGIDLIKRLHARFPDVRTLVASMHDEGLYADRALQAGALGYVSKQEPAEKMVEAVRLVLRGEIYLSPAMATRMFAQSKGGERKEPEDPIAKLSDRELEVFEAVGRGRRTRAIADQLKLSVKTVETHRENIKRKLGLTSNTELIQRSFRWILEQE